MCVCVHDVAYQNGSEESVIGGSVLLDPESVPKFRAFTQDEVNIVNQM